jgi:hypothetical protein
VFVELAIILAYSFLQTLYFGVGALELILVLILLGIVPWRTPSPPPRQRETTT